MMKTETKSSRPVRDLDAVMVELLATGSVSFDHDSRADMALLGDLRVAADEQGETLRVERRIGHNLKVISTVSLVQS